MLPPPPKPPIVPADTALPSAAEPLLLPPKPPLTPTAPLVLPAGFDQILHPMGTTGLADFLAFARDFADLTVPGTGAASGSTPMDLSEAWRDAADAYHGLASAETHPKELPGIFPFPEGMKAHVDAFLAAAHVQREFDQVPVALGMVPLEYLIAAPVRLNMSMIDSHSSTLSAGSIGDLSLARLCLPLDAPSHSARVLEQNADSLTVVSDNPDLRFMRARAIAGGDASGRGQLGQTLAVEIGFPGNVLNVIRYQNRLILNNGYHRVYALLLRGVTHVPAVIQVCRHWDDVGLVGGAALYENKATLIDLDRPPLMKDYADRRLCMHFAVQRMRKYVRIRYQVETGHL